MEKVLKWIVLLIFAVFLISCKNDNVTEDRVTDNVNKTATPIITEELKTSGPEEEEYEVIWELHPISYVDEYRDAEGNLLIGADLIENADCFLYINEEEGYSVEIPLYCKKYLLILENDELDRVEFRFYGRSVVGRGWHYYDEPNIGVYLFSIVDEEFLSKQEATATFDNDGQIGTINGVKYYAISSTDFSLSVLVSECRYMEEGTSYFQDSEEEKQLIIADREIADKIYDEIRNIMATFSVLN